MTRDDLYAALACANLLDQKYPFGGAVTFERQAANQLRLLCDEVGHLRDEIASAVAAEREKVAAWMIALSYATGHGDTIEDLLEALVEQVEERVTNAIRARGKQQ